MKSLRGLGASPCLLWSEVPPASGKMVQRRAPPSPPRPCEALVTGGGGRSRSVNCVRDLGSPPLGDRGHSLPLGGKGGGLSSPHAVVFTSVQGPLFPACLLGFPLERPGSSPLSSSCCSAAPRVPASWEDAVCHSAGISGVLPTGGTLSQRP